MMTRNSLRGLFLFCQDALFSPGLAPMVTYVRHLDYFAVSFQQQW